MALGADVGGRSIRLLDDGTSPPAVPLVGPRVGISVAQEIPVAVPGAIMTGVFLTAGAPELDRATDVAEALAAIAAVPFGDDALERDRMR